MSLGEEAFSYRTEARYGKMPEKNCLDRVNEILDAWERFWNLSQFDKFGWMPRWSTYALSDVAIRVDKRKEYYAFFHDMKIKERKYAGLVAYWIVKFHPFSVDVRNPSELTPYQDWLIGTLNERFAAYLLYSAILGENSRSGKDAVPLTTKDKGSYYEALLYALRYRCITIDSMMLLVETMTPDDFDRLVSKK